MKITAKRNRDPWESLKHCSLSPDDLNRMQRQLLWVMITDPNNVYRTADWFRGNLNDYRKSLISYSS